MERVPEPPWSGPLSYITPRSPNLRWDRAPLAAQQDLGGGLLPDGSPTHLTGVSHASTTLAEPFLAGESRWDYDMRPCCVK